MILVIDNYDSFTFNVIQILQTVTDKEIKVVRNDEFTAQKELCVTMFSRFKFCEHLSRQEQ